MGGADIAFYVGDTGRIHTSQCVRPPFPGARQPTGMSDCFENNLSFRVAMGLRPTQLDENPREVYDMVDVEL